MHELGHSVAGLIERRIRRRAVYPGADRTDITGPEVEELGEPLPAGRTARDPSRDGRECDDPLRQQILALVGQYEEQVELVLEVFVEGPAGKSCTLDDLIDVGPVVAAFSEAPGASLEDPGHGHRAAGRQCVQLAASVVAAVPALRCRGMMALRRGAGMIAGAQDRYRRRWEQRHLQDDRNVLNRGAGRGLDSAADEPQVVEAMDDAGGHDGGLTRIDAGQARSAEPVRDAHVVGVHEARHQPADRGAGQVDVGPLDEQGAVLLVHLRPVQKPLGEVLEPLLGRPERADPAHDAVQGVATLVEELDEDFFFALEVLVERGGGNLGGLGDIPNRGLVEPDAGEEG